MKKNLTFLAILFVVFLMPFSALASTYTINSIGFNSAGSVNIKLNGSNESHSVGAFTVSFAELDESFTAFCIDPDQPIGTGSNKNLPVELVPVSTVPGGLEAAWLLQEYGDDMDAGAMQVALWEVVKDTDYDLDSGNFILNSASNNKMRGLANDYLDDLAANFDATGLNALFMASKHPEKQDLVYLGTVVGDTGAVVTPEPATMVLLGFGIFGLAGLRKKIRKS